MRPPSCRAGDISRRPRRRRRRPAGRREGRCGRSAGGAGLRQGRAAAGRVAGRCRDAPEGTVPVPAPMQGTIVSLSVKEGDAVAAGQPLLIMDAMKMQHEIRSPARGYVRRIAVEAGETIYEGHALLFVEEADVEVKGAAVEEKIDLDHIRPDLAEYFERRAMTLDDKRPEAVARRRKTNQRTARQNLDDLVDPGSFIEWGAFAIASQRTRRTIEDLIEKTPADGLITGIGRVNGSLFGPETRAGGGRALRLHGAGRHPGQDQPSQEGPAVRDRRGAAHAAGLLHRRRRRPAGRRRRAVGRRPQHHGLPHLRPAERGVAAGRHQFGPLLRRQCGAARLLRRGDRHQELVDRHGRAGDDRGRQSRRVLARGSRPDERAGAQRHGRHRGRGRGGGGRRRQEVPVVLPGRAAGMARAPTSGCCAAPSRRTGCGSTTCAT